MNLFKGVAKVSIHAPTRGATDKSSDFVWKVAKFQSTRPRGARLLEFNSSEFQLIMQSIPRTQLCIANLITIRFETNNNVLINKCRENTTFFAILALRDIK